MPAGLLLGPVFCISSVLAATVRRRCPGDWLGGRVGRQARKLEEAAGLSGAGRAKIVMTTALGDESAIRKAIQGQCEGYLVKPYGKAGLLDHLRAFGLIG